MTLTELAGLNQYLSASDIIAAYKKIVQRLSLDPIIIPVCFTTNTVKIGGFDNLASTPNGSEVAIKEIVHIFDAEIVDSLSVIPEYSTLLVGKINSSKLGLDDNYDTYTDEDYEDYEPEIYVSGNEITINNFEDSPGVVILNVIAFVYPYLIPLPEPYANVRDYDTDNSGETDELLGCFASIQALKDFSADNGFISEEGRYMSLLNHLCNVYNYNYDNMLSGFSSYDLNIGSSHEL